MAWHGMAWHGIVWCGVVLQLLYLFYYIRRPWHISRYPEIRTRNKARYCTYIYGILGTVLDKAVEY